MFFWPLFETCNPNQWPDIKKWMTRNCNCKKKCDRWMENFCQHAICLVGGIDVPVWDVQWISNIVRSSIEKQHSPLQTIHHLFRAYFATDWQKQEITKDRGYFCLLLVPWLQFVQWSCVSSYLHSTLDCWNSHTWQTSFNVACFNSGEVSHTNIRFLYLILCDSCFALYRACSLPSSRVAR